MGFSFLQLILLSDAQGGVLLHILGVSIEDRLQDVGGLALDAQLAPGQWRELSDEEVAKITR